MFLILWGTAVIMLPSNPLHSLPGRDSGVFLYGGQQILDGEVPYLAFWDHKGPLIYLLNAFGLLLGGGLRWGVWTVEFGSMALAALAFHRVARKQQAGSAALLSLAAFAYGWHALGVYRRGESNYTETYSLLFNVLAVLCWLRAISPPRRRWLFVAVGLMGGVSVLLRPNNIGPVATIALVEIIRAVRAHRWHTAQMRLLLMSGGAGVVVLAAALWLLGLGAADAAFDAILRYNMVYVRSSTSGYAEVFLRGLGYQSYLPLIALSVLLVCSVQRSPGGARNQGTSEFVLFLLIGFPLEACLTAVSGRVYPHYYIAWVPYTGWLVGSAALAAFPRVVSALEDYSERLLPLLALLALVLLSLPSARTYAEIWDRLVLGRDSGVESTNAVVEFVTAHTDPGDTVLVWGNDVWINFLADRRSPSRYSYQYPLFLAGYTSTEMASTFLLELKQARPELVVGMKKVDLDEISPLPPLLAQAVSVPGPDLPEAMRPVLEYIKAAYCQTADLKDAIIYRRRAAADLGPSCR
jgi:hypothetical protein